MHVLVTGAAGLIGGRIMVSLLQQGHQVTATDINPIPAATLDEISPYRSQLAFAPGDLTDPKLMDVLFETGTIDAVAHIGGIRSPLGLDPRLVHNINVTSSYNVLQTAAAKGVKRIIQASSCNALGLSWTRSETWQLDFVPVNESHPMRPVSAYPRGFPVDKQEDPYSLSKLICEEQAKAICRMYPQTRIASIRMHFTRASINETTASVKHTGLWSWSSVDAVVRACILGLTSEGWTGAEAFHVAAEEIFFPKELSGGVEIPALELLEKHWPGEVRRIDREWWEGSPRRSFFDTSKAQTMLGWKHDL